MELMNIALQFLALVVTVVIHEVMHGYVAFLLGDDTAKTQGRLSLNPIAHIDPFGSVILPLFLIISGSPIIFGAAKPVPINPHRFKDYHRGMMLVGLAGPLSNLAIAALAAIIFKLFAGHWPILSIFFQYLILISVILGVFNLIPIPPLDGSRVLNAFLPPEGRRIMLGLEQYGIFILILFLVFFNNFFWNFIIGPPVDFILTLFGFG